MEIKLKNFLMSWIMRRLDDLHIMQKRKVQTFTLDWYKIYLQDLIYLTENEIWKIVPEELRIR